MAHVWRGVLREYADRLGVTDASTVVTLGEGGTPLLPAPALSRRTGADVWVKFEGMNPTGSFKDRGMTVAVSRAIEHGAKAVICASTGNTSASAAAYAAHAGITAAVLVPEGKIAMGKLSQAVAHNGRLIQIRGNFDDCLEIARELADHYPVHLVNSVNPDRIEGQKTAAYEIVEVLGDAPDFHFIPVGNAGNYTAYSRGYREEAERGVSTRVPRMFGFQAEGSAPLVRGEVVKNPETVASAIRIGNPASWDLALEAREATDGYFGAIDDDRILAAQKLLAGEVGIFVEPASAISVAGLLDRVEAGVVPQGARVVLTVTGHGLKDPQWALRNADGSSVEPTVVDATTSEVASVLGLARGGDRVSAAAEGDRAPSGRSRRRAGAGDEREPRSRLRHARPRAERVRRAPRHGAAATAGSRSRCRARAPPTCPRDALAPRRARDRVRVRSGRTTDAGAAPRRRATSSRTAGGSARPARPSSRACSRRRGCSRATSSSAPTPCCGSRPSSRATPTTSRRRCSAA